MGCCCGKGVPDRWSFGVVLPEGFVRLTETTDKALVAKAQECAALAFAGSKTTAPEPGISWSLDPMASGEDPCGPLMEDPSQERIDAFRWIIKWEFAFYMRHNAAFALVEGDDVQGVMLCVPPNDSNAHEAGCCTILKTISKTGGPPKTITQAPTKHRLEAVDKAMASLHKRMMDGEHWYVRLLATAPTHQGKGVGKRILQFAVDLADQYPAPSYLETAHEAFYEKMGYKTEERVKVEDASKFPGDVFNGPHGGDSPISGGIAGMVYRPSAAMRGA